MTLLSRLLSIGSPFPGFASKLLVIGYWLLAIGYWPMGARAADPAPLSEEQSFQSASRLFQERLYDESQKALNDFITLYPRSARVPEAVLLQGQSQLKQGNQTGALLLLAQHFQDAGEFRDRFIFWQAEAEYGRQNFGAAATNYARLLEDFPESAQRLAASYGEAFSYFKMTNSARTVELLSATNGSFQTAARRSTNSILVAEGNMLLAEAYFAAKDFKQVEVVLSALGERPLNEEMNSKRLFLLGANAFADKRASNALSWLAQSIAVATNLPVARASALNLQAEIYREPNPDLAVDALRKITDMSGLSTNQVHQALFKISEILASSDRVEMALQSINNFIAKIPGGVPTDEIKFRLGDLYLMQFRKQLALASNSIPAGVMTNLTAYLGNARKQYDSIITNSPAGSWVGKALLQEGWSFWEEWQLAPAAPASSTALGDASRAFKNAADRLAMDEDQAVAKVKFAECLYLQKSLTNAIEVYEVVLNSFGNLPNIKSRYFDKCLYQIIRARLDLGDFAKAFETRERLVTQFPQSQYAPLSLLAISQTLLLREQPAQARDALQGFLDTYANSSLTPQIRIEIARSFIQETNWGAAIAEYETLPSLTNSTPFLAESEFWRAWCYDRSGNSSNALALFTNYVVRFESNALAPSAMWWIADRHLANQDYRAAEVSYQRVLQLTNGLSTPMRLRAQLMSASAALRAVDGSEAPRIKQVLAYLEPLMNGAETNVPPDIYAQALFMISEAKILQQSSDNPLARFDDAITPLRRLLDAPADTNWTGRALWVARAKVRLGDIYFQLGGVDAQHAKSYSDALTNYLAAGVKNPAIDISVRSQAEVGLGKVKERLASLKANAPPDEPLLREALDHFLAVFNGTNLLAGERPDPYWVKTSGLEAAAMAHKLNRKDVETGIYELLLREFPDSKEIETIVRPKLAALK